MESLESIISALESLLNTKRKRHIAGGILMSMSLLFIGLTFTIVTIKTEENGEITQDDYSEEDYHEL